jgi:hypothetical protein
MTDGYDKERVLANYRAMIKEVKEVCTKYGYTIGEHTSADKGAYLNVDADVCFIEARGKNPKPEHVPYMWEGKTCAICGGEVVAKVTENGKLPVFYCENHFEEYKQEVAERDAEERRKASLWYKMKRIVGLDNEQDA